MFCPEIAELATQVLQKARNSGVSLATAESCTGGLIIGALTEIAGSSDVVDRGFVTYSNQAKIDILTVSPRIIEHYGAVSESCARAMAEGALKTATTPMVAVAVTGVAGPGGGTDKKPVGLVHIACAHHNGTTIHQHHNFTNIGRDNIRQATVIAALKLFQRGIT